MLFGEVDSGDLTPSALSHSAIAESTFSCNAAAAFNSLGAELCVPDALVEEDVGFGTKLI
ncbi:hypothetical protein PTW32_15990 [Dechloromonas agitata]|uniref:hypothetical protein n=1 Tax=Dechloromonas agitata TaxID=73030 RepID=UPI00237DDA50|nr:hypothetical protein [Dechloromonas agitata]MDE1546918.1 hypothetical protein [Dechloromonas agitata]